MERGADGSPITVTAIEVAAADALASPAVRLVERGLARYGRGDLLGALCEWEHALALAPETVRATEFVAYVRDNFELLEEHFRSARDEARRLVAQRGPVAAGADDLMDHDEFELRFASTPSGPAVPPLARARRSRSPVDEGWSVDELAGAGGRTGPLSLRGEAAVEWGEFSGSPVAVAPPGFRDTAPGVESPVLTGVDAGAELALDDAGAELALDDAGAELALDNAGVELELSIGHETGQRMRGSVAAPMLDVAFERDSFSDDNTKARADEWKTADVTPGARSSGSSSLAELLGVAQAAAAAGDGGTAVDSVEAALDAAGGKLPVPAEEICVRLLLDSLGGADRIPMMMVPMHAVSGEKLDARSGFILSRIDGMLSWDDILDVSGMPRLEACLLLARLVRRGIIVSR